MRLLTKLKIVSIVKPLTQFLLPVFRVSVQITVKKINLQKNTNVSYRKTCGLTDTTAEISDSFSETKGFKIDIVFQSL